MKTFAFAAALLGLAVGVLGVAPGAQAQTAARIESQTRPGFGLLLDPPASQGRPRAHRRWSYGAYRPDHGPDRRPPFVPGREEIVLIDCGAHPGPGAVEAAVRRVRPGGTLVIRARAGACVGWLNIDKPMTILGEGGFDPRGWSQNPAPTLQAPDGLPCITVTEGVRLELRDVVLASPNGGRAACVVGYGAEIVMSRVGFRHAGDEAALYADGGRVDLRDVVIDAQTAAPAIVIDGATLTAWETVVTGARSGIDITPAPGEISRIASVTLSGAEGPGDFGPRAIGLLVGARRDYGRVEVADTRVCGYAEGVAVEGASVSIQNSRICRSDKGLVLYNGELTLLDSRVRARAIGVAAASGRAVVRNNSFVGVLDVFHREPRAIIDASGNRVWTDAPLCRPAYRPRYRDRHEPYWIQEPDQGWTCEPSPYPRQWWDEMDGAYGDPYDGFVWPPENYARFQEGYGWYDASGRYIESDRHRGDRRWGGR